MRRNIVHAFAFAVATTVLLAVAAPARAQSIILPTVLHRNQPFRGSSQQPLWINYADCIARDVLTFRAVAFSGYSTTSGLILQVWAGSSACSGSDSSSRIGANPTCWLVYSQTPSNATSQDISIRAQDIVGQDIIASSAPPTGVPHRPDDTACDNANGVHQSLVLDFMFVDGTNAQQGTDAQWTQTGYDITPPAPPSAITAGSGDTRVHVSWASPADPDIVQYQIYCNPPPGPIRLPDGGLLPAGPPPLGTLSGLLTDAQARAIGSGSGGSGSTITPVVTNPDGGTTLNIAQLKADSCDPNSVLAPGGFPPPGTQCGTAGKTSLNGVASGLVDGFTYEVAVAATDTVGNVGRLSSNKCAPAEKLIDFFELYRADGGQGGGGILLDLAYAIALGAALARSLGGRFRRTRSGTTPAPEAFVIDEGRTKRALTTMTLIPPARALGNQILALLSFASLFVVAGTARAQGVDEFGVYGRSHERGTQVESPQHVAVELRVGRYVPGIDNEFSNATPYKTIFGTDNRYSVGLEVDWQALRIPYLGTLGVGGGFAYTKIKAPALVASDLTPSDEDTSLTLFPLYAVAVLRADYIARTTGIPLVPYAKLGVGAGLWRATNGGGTANAGGVKGSGISYGPQFALGGMLLLDTFDPDAAMEMDEGLGINNSYIFIEWYDSLLNGFGSGGQLQVGTNTWVLGLAFEI